MKTLKNPIKKSFFNLLFGIVFTGELPHIHSAHTQITGGANGPQIAYINTTTFCLRHYMSCVKCKWCDDIFAPGYITFVFEVCLAVPLVPGLLTDCLRYKRSFLHWFLLCFLDGFLDGLFHWFFNGILHHWFCHWFCDWFLLSLLDGFLLNAFFLRFLLMHYDILYILFKFKSE